MGGPIITTYSKATKIKGGKWTVAKFFIVSIAYTSVWLAISSELAYYKELYGPQILLLLNLYYYAPSIPILICQSFLDEQLEQHLGVARTIGIRLSFSLITYAALCAAFPFLPTENHWYLLLTVAILGALSSIAFSASYQLVARFANKNVIALGLGCSASGPLVLIIQILIGMKGKTPTLHQHIILYTSISILVLGGLWATVSLLFRHWDAIESSNNYDDNSNTSGGGGATTTTMRTSSSADDNDSTIMNDTEAGDQSSLLSQPLLLSTTDRGMSSNSNNGMDGATTPRPRTPLSRRPSIQAAMIYNVLEPYEQPYLSTRGEWLRKKLRRLRVRVVGRRNNTNSNDNNTNDDDTNTTINQDDDLYLSAEDDDTNDGDTHSITNDDDDDTHSDTNDQSPTSMLQAIRSIWPALIAIGIQSGIALTLFPFFTYMPSSGLLGDELPKVLFFGRIFADLLGRMLPRWGPLHPSSIWPVLTVALCKVAMEPFFFIYLKSPEYMHSDVAAVVYVCVMWAASGYVNTAANMHAPHMVEPHLKSVAAGMMAITYQIGHFIGLSLAVLLVWLLYGKIGVH